MFALFQTSLNPNDIPDHNDTNERTIPTFLTLYIFGFVYELCLVYDALRLKNTIQVIGLCMYNYALLMYAAIQMTQINDAANALRSKALIEPTVWSAERPFLIAIPCVIAVGSLAMSFVARRLYDEFAWTIYKHISADLKMKRRYLTYQVSVSFQTNRISADCEDLHHRPQIRLFLLHRLYHPIPRDCGQPDQRRILSDHRRYSSYNFNSYCRWCLHTTRMDNWYARDHCKSSHRFPASTKTDISSFSTLPVSATSASSWAACINIPGWQRPTDPFGSH